MQLVVTGVSHRTAPLNIRERLAVPAGEIPQSLRALQAETGECLILSTCNRVEVYAVCGHVSSGAALLRQWIGSRGGLTASEAGIYSYTYGHEEAALHAFRVASGLDSMVVGEDQILGQMRRAIGTARAAGTLGPTLDRLGTAALACGKRARASLELGHASPSVVSVALEAATRLRGTLDGANIVVVGSGETASLALQHLRGAAPSRVTVVSRTEERSAALALAMGVDAAPWDTLAALVANADVVLGCTSSPRVLIDAPWLRDVRHGTDAPLVCVDLGVPRDIDPAVGEIDGVTLLDIDAIGSAVGGLHVERRHQLAAAEALVADEVDRFMTWWRERAVAPTIARLHARADAITAAELDRALSRLDGLTPREADIIRALAERITSKLLHEPTLALKRHAEGANMAMVIDHLFRLTSLDAAAPEDTPRTHASHSQPGDYD